VSAGSAARPSRRRTIAAAAAIGVLVITIGALAFRGPAAPASAEADVAPEEHAETKLATAASLPAPKAPLVTNPAASKTISADVPLFGPTPMATMEPAPLGAPPEDMTGVAAEEAAELRAAQATPVDDEKFPDDAPQQAKKKQAPDPRDVAPWGQGRMRQPTIHRLRLDGPGGAIQGAMQPTGFTVVIPGRKVMEAGKYIQKRDDRIARVRTNNGASGAQVSFQFRDGVPAYRVRLRKDFVEFLISAPDSKAKTSRKRSEKSSTKSGARRTTKSGDKVKSSG
jgi:hypothetical protein